tara:strand:+ start:95 stop:247 length:153 start_codon:yes stop_codon:yes gene_type:complete
VNRLPKSRKNVTLKLGDFINVSEFMIVGADVPVLPLGVGNMFASQCNLLS